MSSITSTVLPTPGAAEHRGLPALRERREEIDHLDASREQFRRPGLRREWRRLAVNGPARRVGRQRRAAVADPAEHVEQTAERRLPDRDVTGPPAGRALSPRLTPVVGSSAIARARCASRWAWISATTTRPSESTISTASSIDGNLSSKARSMTAPRIATTRPSNGPSVAIEISRFGRSDAISHALKRPKSTRLRPLGRMAAVRFASSAFGVAQDVVEPQRLYRALCDKPTTGNPILAGRAAHSIT